MMSGVLLTLPLLGVGLAPQHSWDTLGGMSFFHACNESGLFSEAALDVITKFPMVTIEKGQGFLADDCADFNTTFPCAEAKIAAQCRAVKQRKPSIATVFYMNSVLDWYFYHMHLRVADTPSFELHDSTTGKPVLTSGDKHFNPPKGGMLVYNHADEGMRDFWFDVCLNATKDGSVDGCFSDSSQPGSHKTSTHLNAADEAAFEDGKVATMSRVTKAFGGTPGKPYKGSTGVLLGKRYNQSGINAFQIEFFEANKESIETLMAGVANGYLVQAHAGVDSAPSTKGCNDLAAMTDVVAAFLIGAGEYSYFGSGPWISPNLADVEQRWCDSLFARPIGRPLGAASLDGHVYRRSFAAGTNVTFNTQNNRGHIDFAS